MNIVVIGAGRMGKVLAARMAVENEVSLYDADGSSAKTAAEKLGLSTISSLVGLNVDAVVLAIPDSAVGPCIAELRKSAKLPHVFSVATNISREMLEGMAVDGLRCLNVKIIGHAGEMAGGAKPAIVIDQGDMEMMRTARHLFAAVGTVLTGDADLVKLINNVATEEALKACVSIERVLKSAGITDPEMVRGALSQVAPGVMRAYAEDDLGPFARKIISALHDKTAQ